MEVDEDAIVFIFISFSDRAVDLLVLFDSFKLGTGRVEKVTIYPSEYGAKRMAEENELGPVELREDHEDEEDGMEGRKWEAL